jgi:AcrR family transcriptional regulator
MQMRKKVQKTVAARAAEKDGRSSTGPQPAGAPKRRERKRAHQQRAIDTRNQLIAAAAKGFAKHGFEGVSTRMISKAAGVQHTLITYHFGTKEDLWRAVMTEMHGLYKTKMQDRLKGVRKSDDVTKLRVFWEEFIRFAALHPEWHALMSQVAGSSDERLKWLVDNIARTSIEDTVELIRSSQKAKRFVEGDPYMLFYLLLGAATRIYMVSAEFEAITGRSMFNIDTVEQHIKTCMGIFFIDPPRTRPRARAK